MARHIRPEVPVHIGRDAHNILKAASVWVPNGHAFAAPCFIAPREPVEIGPLRVTPYLVDHSAFDAYALLVEACGKRVFYSGDFRVHGRKRKLFEAMVANPPGDIDILLMEERPSGERGRTRGSRPKTLSNARSPARSGRRRVCISSGPRRRTSTAW